ncbi:hypothetical protein BJ508DRAFT_315731 [Ascobolus immersus RN42]|uniref:Uncharacterized protein n=1 Tax=Ascobolus immersus RN42 TaxID=1160509 RepID=A0A3N4HGX2_ASCIM|nr:hypothetical protein BJ508DRAFT_315731 [Ascobolus immersus RN42]
MRAPESEGPFFASESGPTVIRRRRKRARKVGEMGYRKVLGEFLSAGGMVIFWYKAFRAVKAGWHEMSFGQQLSICDSKRDLFREYQNHSLQEAVLILFEITKSSSRISLWRTDTSMGCRCGYDLDPGWRKLYAFGTFEPEEGQDDSLDFRCKKIVAEYNFLSEFAGIYFDILVGRAGEDWQKRKGMSVLWSSYLSLSTRRCGLLPRGNYSGTLILVQQKILSSVVRLGPR